MVITTPSRDADPDSDDGVMPDELPVQLQRALAVCAVIWAVIGTWLLTTDAVPRSYLSVDATLAHAVIFFGLTLSLWALFYGRSRRAFVTATVMTAIAAPATELVQRFLLSNRTGSVEDVFVDMAGGAVAILIFMAARALLGLRTARLIAAAGSIATLLLIVANLFAAHPDVVRRWQCRDQPSISSEAGPLVRLVPEARETLELENAKRVLCRVTETDEVTVAVRFRSDNITQDGPTRLVTSSVGWHSDEVNIHIGQTGANLSVRVRRAVTLRYADVIIENALRPGVDQSVAVRIGDGEASVWVDGLEVGSMDQLGNDLDSWTITYPLIVGDEAGGDRRFEGTIWWVEIYDRLLSDTEMAQLG
jgi:VanZ family protein